MLKGHVFTEQIFGNEIFALFIDTFLDKKNGIARYKEEMALSYNENTITVRSGCVCVRGRFIEEDSSKDIIVESGNDYCVLVIEVDLNQENTEEELKQVTYKVLKGINNYPELTKNDIVEENLGIYQFELARFRMSNNQITEFQDKRVYLDLTSIYEEIKNQGQSIIENLEEELTTAKEGSIYVLKESIKSGLDKPTDDIGVNGDMYMQYFD